MSQQQLAEPIFDAPARKADISRFENGKTRDPRAHLQAALIHVEAALEVFDPEHMPYDHGTATKLRDRIRVRIAGL